MWARETLGKHRLDFTTYRGCRNFETKFLNKTTVAVYYIWNQASAASHKSECARNRTAPLFFGIVIRMMVLQHQYIHPERQTLIPFLSPNLIQEHTRSRPCGRMARTRPNMSVGPYALDLRLSIPARPATYKPQALRST